MAKSWRKYHWRALIELHARSARRDFQIVCSVRAQTIDLLHSAVQVADQDQVQLGVIPLVENRPHRSTHSTLWRQVGSHRSESHQGHAVGTLQAMLLLQGAAALALDITQLLLQPGHATLEAVFWGSRGNQASVRMDGRVTSEALQLDNHLRLVLVPVCLVQAPGNGLALISERTG